MHDFFTPEHDRQLGSQLRREALAARCQTEVLQARISRAVRNDLVASSGAISRGPVSLQPAFYALAVVLCLALALPVLWIWSTPVAPLRQADPISVATNISTPPLPAEAQVPSETVEVDEEDLSLLAAHAEAAVDTLMAALPVDVDIDELVP